MRMLVVLSSMGLAACAHEDSPSKITYENLVQPFATKRDREPLYCYAVGHRPFFVLSYGECVSKHGRLVFGVAAQWLDENWRWFQRPGWEALTRETQRVSKELEAKGYDPNSKLYTTELTRRLAAFKNAHPKAIPKRKARTA